MTAFEILTATAADLDLMMESEIAGYRAKLVELGKLGFTEICGLDLVDGIARLDAESARRVEYVEHFAAELDKHDGDVYAMLFANFA